jgi:pantoate kinase
MAGIPHADLPVSQQVYHLFAGKHTEISSRPLQADHCIDLPQGSGFGTSGAGALSLALALNAHCGAPLTEEEAGRIAHEAEVECRTGLGTVIGEFYGGFEIRIAPGAPGIGKVRTVKPPEDLRAVFAVFGSYSTREALADEAIRERINRHGRRAHEELQRELTVERFLRASRDFSFSTGLLTPRCSSALKLLEREGFIGGMLMFGDAVFTLSTADEVRGVSELLARTYPEAEVFSADLDSEGGRVL